MSPSLLESKFKKVDRARLESASPDKDCCAICFDPIVSDDQCRSLAKLQCGHEFHLKCVSLAFTAKNRMECPYCRNVESEEWKLVAAAAEAVVQNPSPRRRYRDISELMADFDHTESNNSRPILGLPDRTSERPHSSHNPANFLPHMIHADHIRQPPIIVDITASEYRAL